MQQRVSNQVAEYMNWSDLAAPAIKPVDTGVVVLTGNQCAGKTTMINRLHENGYPIIPEGLRDIFEEGAKSGIPMNDLKNALPEIVSTCLARHVSQVVTASQQGGCTVADRGLGDLLAGMLILQYAAATPALFRSWIPWLAGEEHYLSYLKDDDLPFIHEELGHQIENLKEWAKTLRYDKVLWLESMPNLERDGIRPENLLIRGTASYFIQRAWRELGYEVEQIPAMYQQLDKRVEMVLSRLPENQPAAEMPPKEPVPIASAA